MSRIETLAGFIKEEKVGAFHKGARQKHHALQSSGKGAKGTLP